MGIKSKFPNSIITWSPAVPVVLLLLLRPPGKSWIGGSLFSSDKLGERDKVENKLRDKQRLKNKNHDFFLNPAYPKLLHLQRKYMKHEIVARNTRTTMKISVLFGGSVVSLLLSLLPVVSVSLLVVLLLLYTVTEQGSVWPPKLCISLTDRVKTIQKKTQASYKKLIPWYICY